MATSEYPMATNESPAHIAKVIFSQSPYHEVRYLNCSFHDGVLTIVGSVSRFHLKQVAQTAVQGIDGVKQIENRIVVKG